MVMHARVRAEQGRLREADEAFRGALRLLTEEGFELSPAAGIVHIGIANLRYERDDLDGAEGALERGMELAERTGDVSTLVWAYVTISRNKRARGEEGGALERAHQAERVARDSGADLQIAIALAWMTRLLLARGDLTEAVAFEKERAANADDPVSAARGVDRLSLARLLYAQGRHREALPLLGELGETAEAAGRTGRPHRDPGSASTGTVGSKREGASRKHPRRNPRSGSTGGIREDLRRRGSADGRNPLRGARSSAERTPRLATPRPCALHQEAPGCAGAGLLERHVACGGSSRTLDRTGA
jgi:hypothetical protein